MILFPRASFHPSKEGFKEWQALSSPKKRRWFPSLKGRFQSIFSAGMRHSSACFHPSKEGFKGDPQDFLPQRLQWFPSLKGRFQRTLVVTCSLSSSNVSIPQRKVSKDLAYQVESLVRQLFPSLKGRFQSIFSAGMRHSSACFHPSKEGFKEAATSFPLSL